MSYTLDQQIEALRWYADYAGKRFSMPFADQLRAAVATLERLQSPPNAEALEAWRIIETLTEHEADSVTFLCANPDFNDQPDHAVLCNGGWTEFVDIRFVGDTRIECLRLALAAKERS
jgi:hypothetical protein